MLDAGVTVDAAAVDAAVVDAAAVDAAVVDAIDAAAIDAAPDAPIDGGRQRCNLFTQTGCAAGEKCTWIVDIDGGPTTPDIGHIGCAPSGTTPHGAACVDASMSAVDTCVAGNLCLSRKCKSICDPTVVADSGPGSCPTIDSCNVYAGVFEEAGQPVAGVCERGCEPLTQALLGGGGAACGSADPARPSSTCVASGGFLAFHCAPSGSIVYDKIDRQPPLTDPTTGTPFGNGCAPGFMPFYREDAASTTVLCSGICAPVKMDSSIATSPSTPPNVKPWGDTSALGKLVVDPAAVSGHSICTAGIKGSLTAANGGVEDCRYLWFPLAEANQGHVQPSPFNDTIGLCFAYSRFRSVTVPGIPDPQPQKSCADLPVTAPPDDPYGSAVENGCYPLADSQPPRARRSGTRGGFRVAHGAGLALRHVFD